MLANIPKQQKITVMIGVMLAMLLAALDQTIVATAMPRIVRDLNGLEHLSWVITSYLLASTIIVPIYGKLSDIYGRKYFIMSAVVIFLIGSMLSGMSQNMTQLIIFRAIQGLGGGAIFANAFAVIGDLFPPSERGKWQGLFGAMFGIASIIGPTLGGWLTDNASWRWNFYINLPIGIAALAVIGFLMPKIVPDIKDKSIDFLGALALTISLVTLLLGFVWVGNEYAWNSPQIVSLFVSAILSMVMFVYTEQRVKEPIIPLSLFKNPIFSVEMAGFFLVGAGMFGAILYVPLFAQIVLGVTATNSGTILTPMMLGMVVMAIITGQLTSRTGRYKWFQVTGAALASISLFLLSQMTPDTSQGEMIFRMITTGMGLGLMFPVFTLAVQNAFDHSKLGVATASTQLFRSVGATVGTAILGGILNTNLNQKLGDLSSDPFVQMAQKINPNFDLSKVNINQFQAILTGQGRQMIEQRLNGLPPAFQPQAISAFNEFLQKVRFAFSQSITEVFLIASGLTAAAFVVSLFLKEIPLRKSHAERPMMEEAGIEMAEEEGDFPSRSEPV